MLKMTNVSKVFRTELVETHALSDFSLSVDEGEFVTITGPSGCGKTTFLNIAGLLETFTAGQYLLTTSMCRSSVITNAPSFEIRRLASSFKVLT